MYTEPNPPAPIFLSGAKLLVAFASSLKVKAWASWGIFQSIIGAAYAHTEKSK
jgi:hypothetical protein